MSKANRPQKVLRTALKRLQKGWTKGSVYKGPGKTSFSGFPDQPTTPSVCLLGALHGYQGQTLTPVSIIAESAVLASINERFPRSDEDGLKWASLPQFNDHSDTTFEMVEEVTKMALIKVETGWEPNSEVIDQIMGMAG